MKKFTLPFVFICFIVGIKTNAQVFSNKEVGPKNQTLSDSLKNSEYPYELPIWGEKATKAGYNLPYSAGISAQFFYQESEIVIENLHVGFNQGPMYDLDGLVRFDRTIANAYATTVRPDIWLFPFLNVYAILGHASASTEVNFGIWLPDSTGKSREVLSTGTVVEFSTTTSGFGFTPTIGVGGGFLALDMNWTWTDVPQLKEPARAFVFGPRFGKNFKLKKESTVAVWAGGFRASISSNTYGNLALSEVAPIGEWTENIDESYAQLDQASQEIDTWWSNLSPNEQQNPVNQAKYNAANATLETAGQILNAANGAVNTVGNSTVQYSMDKYLKDKWNFIVGAQYQFNKHWMMRGELGFLGSRSQFMVGMQYRFGL